MKRLIVPVLVVGVLGVLGAVWYRHEVTSGDSAAKKRVAALMAENGIPVPACRPAGEAINGWVLDGGTPEIVASLDEAMAGLVKGDSVSVAAQQAGQTWTSKGGYNKISAVDRNVLLNAARRGCGSDVKVPMTPL